MPPRKAPPARKASRANKKSAATTATKAASQPANECEIFVYLVDGKPRYADPMEIMQKLDAIPGFDFSTVVAAVDPDNPTAWERTFDAADTARKVFDLPALDPATGKGLTTARQAAVLVAFVAWAADLKKAHSPSPTSPQPTAQGPSDPSTTESASAST